jgi:tetrahydromethanopterin S-methyltransferase subunit G
VLDDSLEERVSRLETDIEWIKKELNDLSHKIDNLFKETNKKVSKSEARLWFGVVTFLLILTQLLIYFMR